MKCKRGTWPLIKRKANEHGQDSWGKRGGAKTSKDLDTKDHSTRFLGHDANNIVSYLPYKLQSVELMTTIRKTLNATIESHSSSNLVPTPLFLE
jgi:hypothetical protein